MSFIQLPLILFYMTMVPFLNLRNKYWFNTINSTTEFIQMSFSSANVYIMFQDPIHNTPLI